MASIRVVGFAVTLALMIAALAGPGSASATVLCENEGVEGGCGVPYPSGTIFAANTEEVTIETPAGMLQCEPAVVKGSLTGEPAGPEEPVPASISVFAFGECILAKKTSCIPSTLNLPYAASISWTKSVDGTLSFEGGAEGGTPTVVIKCGGVSCTVSGKPTFTLSGGKPGSATLATSKAELSSSGLFCTGKAFLTASYTFTSPAKGAVFVLSDGRGLRLCKIDAGPICNAGTYYPKETTLEAVLESETKFTVSISGTKYITGCHSSTFKGKNTTEERYFLEASISQLSFTCLSPCSVKFLTGTSGRIFASDGFGTGKIVIYNPSVEVDCMTYKCTYETKAGLIVPIITGGEPAKLSINMKWDQLLALVSSPGCGAEMEWVGEYKFVLPESSGKPKMWVIRPGISL